MLPAASPQGHQHRLVGNRRSSCTIRPWSASRPVGTKASGWREHALSTVRHRHAPGRGGRCDGDDLGTGVGQWLALPVSVLLLDGESGVGKEGGQGVEDAVGVQQEGEVEVEVAAVRGEGVIELGEAWVGEVPGRAWRSLIGLSGCAAGEFREIGRIWRRGLGTVWRARESRFVQIWLDLGRFCGVFFWVSAGDSRWVWRGWGWSWSVGGVGGRSVVAIERAGRVFPVSGSSNRRKSRFCWGS